MGSETLQQSPGFASSIWNWFINWFRTLILPDEDNINNKNNKQQQVNVGINFTQLINDVFNGYFNSYDDNNKNDNIKSNNNNEDDGANNNATLTLL